MNVQASALNVLLALGILNFYGVLLVLWFTS